MAHKPFTTYRRPGKNGKSVFYIRFRDDDGNLLPGRSSGQFSKGAAESWAYAQLKKGLVMPNKNITFERYAQDWWIYDKCPYIQGKLARGFTPARTYADDMRSMLERHILPYFKNLRLQKITPRHIENWIFSLRKTELSPTTINRCLTCLKIMLKESVRLEYIYKSPADPVLPLKENPRRKSILKIDDVKTLFCDGALNTIWNNDLRVYTANILGASTGMRMGEVRGLKIKCVFPEYVDVQWAFGKYGLQRPKRSSMRQIPIPEKTSISLQELIRTHPYRDDEAFIFWGLNPHSPLDHKVIADGLYAALERIGISKEERAARNITYHSWRHLYNSMMRSFGIPDAKLKRLTGHRTQEMVEHYTRFSVSDYSDVAEIQREVFR